MAQTKVRPTTAAGWRDRIGELQQHRDDLEAQRKVKADERERLALEAQSSKSAAEKLASARREGADLIVAVEDVDAAIRSAEAERQAAEQREAQQAEQKLLEEVDGLIDQRIEAAEEIDQRAAELGQAFDRYDALGDHLHAKYSKSTTRRGVGRHKLASLGALQGALYTAAPRLARLLGLVSEKKQRTTLADRERSLFGRQGHNAQYSASEPTEQTETEEAA